MSSCFNDQNCKLFYPYLKAYVSSTSTDGKKEEPKSAATQVEGLCELYFNRCRREEPKSVQLHNLKNYVSSTSTDGRKQEPKSAQLHKLRPMQALLLQMAERKSPGLCTYRSWVVCNENPIFLSLVSLNFLCFECQTSCKSWIADLTPPHSTSKERGVMVFLSTFFRFEL
jgi:hypothetical protein